MKALRLWESGELFLAQGQVSILWRGSKIGWCAAQILSPSPISSPAPPLGGGGLHKGADGSNDSPTVHPDLLLTLTALLSPVFRCVDGLAGVLRPLEIQRFFKNLYLLHLKSLLKAQAPCLKSACTYTLSRAHLGFMVQAPFPCLPLQDASDHTIFPKLCVPDISWASLTFQVFGKIWTAPTASAGWLDILPAMSTPPCPFILLFIRQLLCVLDLLTQQGMPAQLLSWHRDKATDRDPWRTMLTSLGGWERKRQKIKNYPIN